MAAVAIDTCMLSLLFFSLQDFGINKRQAIDEAKKCHLFFTLINATAIDIIYKCSEIGE